METPLFEIFDSSIRNRGQVLDILLTDKTSTTKRNTHNILWATNSYIRVGENSKKPNPYLPYKEIEKRLIVGENQGLIQPRVMKSKAKQSKRTKDKAEVSTPLKIVRQINQSVINSLKIPKNHWQDFIRIKWLEITCGEGPFITSRYDPTENNPKIIAPEKRVGFLDEKLKLVNQYTDNPSDWLKYAEIALKSSYGYEWQGDNLLIARENILMTLNDFYQAKHGKSKTLESKSQETNGLTTKQLEYFADIIAWNFFQMDGLKCVIPMSCIKKKDPKEYQPKMNPLFDLSNESPFKPARLPKSVSEQCLGCKLKDVTKHIGKYVQVMDWDKQKNLAFYRLITHK